MSAIRVLIFSFLILFYHDAQAAIAVENFFSASSGATLTYSTTHTNDELLLYAISGGTGPCDSTVISSPAGLTWNTKYSDLGDGTIIVTGLNYATAPNILTNDVITVGGNCNAARYELIVISGANTTTPFDTNANANFDRESCSSPITNIQSTISANTAIFNFTRASGTLGTMGYPTGISFLDNAQGSVATDIASGIFSSALSGASQAVSWSGAGSGICARMYLIAIQQTAGFTASNVVQPLFFIPTP